MSSEVAIVAQGLSKSYGLYERPGDRLKELLWGRWLRPDKAYRREFSALKDVSFSIAPGEVVGIVGPNGAGKSTLLQMVCGTLQPSSGSLQVNGRVAALLELGAGFNPDFTGLENIHMNAAILGLSKTQVAARLDDILSFADIGDFIRQPVKTYSSGMFMRLAFAVATSVEPDILVIDEALSVGDGAFARKSFERIMGLKEAGKTILFCSHSTYQVEALCSRAMWIESGTLRMTGSTADVTSAYNESLNVRATSSGKAAALAKVQSKLLAAVAAPGTGRILRVYATANGHDGSEVEVISGQTNVTITLEFSVDPGLPMPTVAFGIADSAGQTVASVVSLNDGVQISTDVHGFGHARLVFTKIPLLKGRYSITSILSCEHAVHPYDLVERSVMLNVRQKGTEQGVVSLPHEWQV